MDYPILQTFKNLLLRDTSIFKTQIIIRCINACLWSSTTIYVSQYIMPQFGVSATFGKFTMISNVIAWGMFESVNYASILVSDIESGNSLSYYLTLPIPTNWIFIRIGLINAYKSFMSTLLLIPVGQLLLWNQISLSEIAWIPLVVSYILAHLFFGFFSVFLASIAPTMEQITTIKGLVTFPLWFFGCYQFSWHMLYKVNPTLAYIDLLNPVTYLMEGIRSTIVTDQVLISYTTCTLMAIFFIIVSGYVGIYKLKKHLDCV